MKTKKLIMISIAIFVIPIVLIFLIYLCTSQVASYDRHVQEVMNMEQTDLDSPISGVRTGIYRRVSSLGENEFECTDDGIYYMCNELPGFYDITGNGKKSESFCDFIFFCPHDSDTMIKLCGRPDCTHDSVNCNAAFMHGTTGCLTYYDGHLYAMTYTDDSFGMPRLWRMKPDGSDRELVLQSSAVSGKHTYIGFQAPYFQNGVFGAGLLYADTDSEFGSGCDWVCSKLNGRNKKVSVTTWGRGWNDGFSFLGGSLLNSDGAEDGNWHLYQWDPETDTQTQLVQIAGEYIDGYWGAEAGYYFDNGDIIKINYPDGGKSVLFDTGLTGSFKAQFFPDCIALLEKKSRSPEDPGMMYFYSWEGEKLGEIAIGVNNELGISLFGGESKDRIMLRGGFDTSLPEYYIEKSDFGTGHIELHKFKYPDLDEKTYLQLFGED